MALTKTEKAKANDIITRAEKGLQDTNAVDRQPLVTATNAINELREEFAIERDPEDQ